MRLALPLPGHLVCCRLASRVLAQADGLPLLSIPLCPSEPRPLAGSWSGVVPSTALIRRTRIRSSGKTSRDLILRVAPVAITWPVQVAELRPSQLTRSALRIAFHRETFYFKDAKRRRLAAADHDHSVFSERSFRDPRPRLLRSNQLARKLDQFGRQAHCRRHHRLGKCVHGSLALPPRC